MARIHVFVPGAAALRPALIMAVLTLGVYFLNSDRTRALEHLKHPFSFLMLGLFGWAIVGAPLGIYPGNSIRFLTEAFLRTGVLVVLVAACVRSIDDIRRILVAVAIGTFVFAFFAALPAGLKGVGAGGYDPNDSAMFMTLAFPLILMLLVRYRGLGWKLFFGVILFVCVVGIVQTGSRGGFLAFLAVVGYSIFFFRGVKPYMRVVVILGVLATMSYAATSEYWDLMESITDESDYNRHSPTGRKAIWERARGYMADNPVFGVGIDNFSVAEGRHPMIAESIARGRGFKYSVAHSIWYQTGAELGFPGLLMYISLFVAAAVYLRRLTKLPRDAIAHSGNEDLPATASALLGSLVAIAVAGTFLSNAYSPMVWGVFGLILGLFKVARFNGIDVTAKKASSRSSGTGAVRRRPARRYDAIAR